MSPVISHGEIGQGVNQGYGNPAVSYGQIGPVMSDGEMLRWAQPLAPGTWAQPWATVKGAIL
jgi:hypothetical protein